MKYFNLILILILILPFTLADEINLQKNKPITFKDIEINLISVGNSGTLRLRIQEQEKLIGKDGEITLYDIKFKNLDANYKLQSAKISLELIAECLVNEDCEKIKPTPCMSFLCNYRSCEFTEIPGCPFENGCRSSGSFEEINDELSYCSEEGWKSRKSYKEECEHNYECLSNLCNGFCSTHIFGGKRMAPSWILILIGCLLLIEALFILLKTKTAKKIVRNITLNFSDKTWKILAIIEILIAVGLILWALI